MTNYTDGNWHLWDRNAPCPVPEHTRVGAIFFNQQTKQVSYFEDLASEIIWEGRYSPELPDGDATRASIHSFRALD